MEGFEDDSSCDNSSSVNSLSAGTYLVEQQKYWIASHDIYISFRSYLYLIFFLINMHLSWPKLLLPQIDPKVLNSTAVLKWLHKEGRNKLLIRPQ